MDYILSTLSNLLGQTAFAGLNIGNVAMIGVACFFLFLAVKKGYEPLLLVPISFGMLLVNIYPPIMEEGGLLNYFFKLDEWAILPCLIFLGVGAQTDFGPLIANPISFLLGAAAQFGIFAAYLGAMGLGFNDAHYAGADHEGRTVDQDGAAAAGVQDREDPVPDRRNDRGLHAPAFDDAPGRHADARQPL